MKRSLAAWRLATLPLHAAVLAQAPGGPRVEVPHHAMAAGGGRHANLTPVSTNDERIRGSMTFSRAQGEVTIEWTYFVDGLRGGLRGRPGYARHRQTFDVPFAPTGVACLDDGRIAIAGVDAMHRVLVEVWTFAEATPPRTRNATGRDAPAFEATVASKRTVYHEPLAGDDLVVEVFRNWAAPDRPFLLFGTSHRVLQLDLVDPRRRAWVASHDGSRGIEAPSLRHVKARGGYTRTHSGVHEEYGAVYWLYTTRPSGIEPLVLVDRDLDGTLDDSFTVPDWARSALRRRERFERFR
ncbi:MAG: hypothetical protein AAF957_11105 [Planctomycetota bacterium]